MTALETVVLKVWSLVQEHQYHLKTQKGKPAGLSPEQLSQILGLGPTLYFNKIASDSDLTAEAVESQKVNPGRPEVKTD